MSEGVEGGAGLAWRLLATLEGGTLLLAASALVVYTTRSRGARQRGRSVRSVLITNTNNTLGKEVKRQLESYGCFVSTVTSATRSGERVGAGNGADLKDEDKVDALVVIGAEPKAEGLDSMAGLVTEDVHENLKLLESLSPLVRSGGYMAWACAGATSGAFSGAAAAFDAALQASLEHTALTCHCAPVWVGRCEHAHEAAARVVASLIACTSPENHSRFSIRNAAYTISGYIGRWLKIVT